MGVWAVSRADLQLRGDSDEEHPSCVDCRAGLGVQVARSEGGRREQGEQPFREIRRGSDEMSIGESLNAGGDV